MKKRFKRYEYPIDQQREWKQTYVDKHGKEHISTYNRTYYERNKEEILGNKKQHYKENGERKREYQRAYKKLIADGLHIPTKKDFKDERLAQFNPFR